MTPDQEALAVAAIRQVQAVYNNAADRGQVDDMITAFAPDGVLDVGRAVYTGPGEIRRFIADVAAGETSADLSGSRHHLTTARFVFDGDDDDDVRGWTYFFVMRQGTVIQEGTYIDRYRRIGGRWLIAHRRVKMSFDVAV